VGPNSGETCFQDQAALGTRLSKVSRSLLTAGGAWDKLSRARRRASHASAMGNVTNDVIQLDRKLQDGRT